MRRRNHKVLYTAKHTLNKSNLCSGDAMRGMIRELIEATLKFHGFLKQEV